MTEIPSPQLLPLVDEDEDDDEEEDDDDEEPPPLLGFGVALEPEEDELPLRGLTLSVPAGPGAPLTSADRAIFAKLASSLPGRQGIAGQRWGIGTLGASAALKGGWGPGITAGQGDGWLDRQLGIATIDGKPVAIAAAARPCSPSWKAA